MTTRPEVPYLLNSVPGPLKDAPLAFAHRGANPQLENTMAAFQHAVDLGFRYIETDVRTTADGQLVIFHDEVLDRVTTGAGKVSEHTWEQLSSVRIGGVRVGGGSRNGGDPIAGEPLVLFEDALRQLPQTHFNVDLKDAEAVPHFVEIVDRLGAHDRVLAASFSDARRKQVEQLFTTPVATSGGWASTAQMVLLRRSSDVDCLQVPVRHGPIRVVRPGFIARCHAAGMQVHVWVVDDPAEMHRLLDMGVDGLMTDDAAALAAVMAERSVWPQWV